VKGSSVFRQSPAKVIHFYRISNLMKKRTLFFLFFVPFCITAQVSESFSDGNFTQNPSWEGMSQNFIVNGSGELQSNASAAANSWLFTPSGSFDNAVWECRVKINYSTSSSNYAAVYVASDVNDLTAGCNGYFIQIGGTNDEVALYLQQGTKKTKIIDGTDKRTDGNPVNIWVKLTRDASGKFTLYSKLPAESEYFEEGGAENNQVTGSSYFGLYYANTTSTGSAYFFDDIKVTGDRVPDTWPPALASVSVKLPDALQLVFNEQINFVGAAFSVVPNVGGLLTSTVSADQKSVELLFQQPFQKGVLYTLTMDNIADKEGNKIKENTVSFGVPEPAIAGDLQWNELMVDAPDGSAEYAEVFNVSDKLIDMSRLGFATRKADGTLNTLNKFAAGTYLPPSGYLAFSDSAELVHAYHSCPANAHIVKSLSWPTLNNDGATLVLCNLAKDTVIDELTYSSKWHHVSVKNTKGVALEKINPELPSSAAASWHSASWETNFGTPGYQNSQYTDVSSAQVDNQSAFRADPEVFSPDNDGVDDICLIRYKLEKNGYVGSVTILNPVGVKICTLATNALLSTEGYIVWDGKTNRNQNANAGIYVIYFDMFNPETGDRMVKKLPLTVTFR